MQELLHFTAEWCQPCKRMAPLIKEYLDNHPEVIYTKIDIDTDDGFVAEYGVSGVPTFIIKTDNEITKRHTGVANPENFAKLFDK
jgi:thiol-disulfide isomerase/thioredoxin